jgi:predicted enzyme related to lactoylglutathione lyase
MTPIHYVEFKSTDLTATKVFYGAAFGWTFTDYGPTYTAITKTGIDGGFEFTDQPIVNGALVILYDDDLLAAKDKVIEAGGTISVDIFSFPGGERFQFIDPSGNELAVWKEIS